MSGTPRPLYWDEATAALAVADPVLAALIAQFPDISLRGRGDAWQTLARSIVGQQISVKAAESVWNRFLAALGGELSSGAVLALETTQLRECGLSGRKVEYLQDLSRHHAAGRLDMALWQDWEDEAIVAELVSIRGIGRWTAEMFLMFSMLRPNVLPLDDIGVVNAIARLYNGGERMTPKAMRELAERWQPGVARRRGIYGVAWKPRRSNIDRQGSRPGAGTTRSALIQPALPSPSSRLPTLAQPVARIAQILHPAWQIAVRRARFPAARRPLSGSDISPAGLRHLARYPPVRPLPAP
ncbi:endonuclease III [Silvimonas terrae]|uniref:DNA-3-methyladenine glycosylase II n=1 Tax=Silvimonas terrae TaxID=300266 RepID=A0A840RD34_9NEIS|nr:endonuclease III [Silvimonas terrae]